VPTGDGTFPMQSTWSNDTNSCAISHPVVGGGTITNDFSIAASPSGATVTAGQGATATVSTAVTSGSAQSVALSASGLPANATASFNPSSITAGGSSTLSITTSSTTPAGSYSITITGTGATATHTTSYSLTVNPVAGPNAVSNGGFESGFTGWATTNITSIVTSLVHSGTSAGRAGTTTVTSGSSTIVQTFTAASGDTKLTFWYDVACSGSARYNYTTVTLHDNTAARTTTPLGKTCVSNSGWRQVTVTITAGHSYTLTLSSHDGSASKPAYATFDDVSTS
jgi:hypothetical protein